MKGQNSDVIVQTLTKARNYFGYSFFLALLSVAVFILKLPKINFPQLTESININDYVMIFMFLSFGILSLVKMFLDDAYESIKYLKSRDSAMQVASFPWPIIKYPGEGNIRKIQSFLTKLIMIFHPVAYILQYNHIKESETPRPVLYLISGVGILLFCIWIFIISCRFKKPILFDSQKEKTKDIV